MIDTGRTVAAVSREVGAGEQLEPVDAPRAEGFWACRGIPQCWRGNGGVGVTAGPERATVAGKWVPEKPLPWSPPGKCRGLFCVDGNRESELSGGDDGSAVGDRPASIP